MMEKYFNGAVEQLLDGLGNTPFNSFMVRYNGEFRISELPVFGEIRKRTDIYVATHEFVNGEIAGGYEPYLSVICEMFRKHMTGSFEDFLAGCDVYYLQRPVILSYFETGVCKREEPVLLDEVEYEQERMIQALENMLFRLSKVCPIAIFLNHFQYATWSTMALTKRLISKENPNIGLFIGVSDSGSMPEFLIPVWDAIYEKLDDGSRVYHIGNAETVRKEPERVEETGEVADEENYRKLTNLVALLDYEQASYLLKKIERRIKFDNLEVADEMKYKMLHLLGEVSILIQDISKALEISEDLEKIHLPGKEKDCHFKQDYLVATAYMYQGKLQEALEYTRRALAAADEMGSEHGIFLAELMETQIQMSGWYNIFFCAQDVKVKQELIQKLIRNNFQNHLAHIYIYAYDNKPEIVAKAYRSEDLLLYFSKGVRIAKKIGNEQLIYMAYQKNIMLASTNGMYEISLLYSIRTFESLRNKESIEAGRIYSGVAYNLCAMGENERAKKYYDKAIKLFYYLRRSEDIAEVEYNRALNCIMCGEYSEAEEYLTRCMKAVEKLHLNSLRVCNLSKLYGLLALVAILQGKRFHCERYLSNCRQFLNYVLEKEQLGGEIGAVHDYAKVDDDMFLYTFSKALLARFDGQDERACVLFEQAEGYLKCSEGNQFFSQALFRKSRMECFRDLGDLAQYKQEEQVLRDYEKQHGRFESRMENMLQKLPPVEEKEQLVTREQLDELLAQESVLLAYQSKKSQLDFISTWQNLIDVTGVSAKEMMEAVMKTFLNHFNIDCAMYVRYRDRKPQVLFNNTGKEMTEQISGQLEAAFRQNMGGFVISKISSNYAKHKNVTSIFGEDEVCSMVAIPFFNNEKMESYLITYVLMKDNWHSSVNRYMLDEDDLNMYQMLFREVKYSLNRIEAYDKIYEMNTKLYLSAVTDQLTGIYNREGFYRKLNSLMGEFKRGEKKPQLGLMFIDLDNFKHYNDTFGHDVGDLILVKMAEIFGQTCADQGFVCRYGGDEFIIVFYTADKRQLEDWAKQIYIRIEEAEGFGAEIAQTLGEQITIRKEERISCSIGIVAKEKITEEEEINTLIKQADDLLYTIKTSTKGTYRI